MAVLDAAEFAKRIEHPVTNIWNWTLGEYTHYRADDTVTYEWATDGDNAEPAAAIDPDSLVAAGYILEWRGNTPDRESETGTYSEIYRKPGTKTAY